MTEGVDNGPLRGGLDRTLLESRVLGKTLGQLFKLTEGGPQSSPTQSIIKGHLAPCRARPKAPLSAQTTPTSVQGKARSKAGFELQLINIPVASIKLYFSAC